jgi:hypothetical protein
MLFGKHLHYILRKAFDELIDYIIEIGNKFNVSDFIRILKPFDMQGVERRLKHVKNRAESFLSKILNEY